MSSVAVAQAQAEAWVQPSKGRVAMFCLILAESAIFTIFVVAYIYNLGKSLYGPTPQVLEVPIWNSIFLLSSSLTIWLAERAVEHGKIKVFGLWWALTFALGTIFLVGTGVEWHKLITVDGLTISTNLFGTTFYSLVGLHASHVILGLIALLVVLLFTVTGHVREEHAERIQVLALYWHFVDAVWIVVFTVVYVIGR
ncbi:cytochrome c oxidase subunit 3 [Pseudacidobacterium ailaaui]|jgi:cytochrome c oxidase subunit 3/cytochrome o ubiquinol oxidase subunit 3|uniref:cytochrome c oxidase subunit 3 n=1 Tax=Pseudacidobacterium ailaaui TaxID=1382359 RepID=UPI00047E4C3C|nr:heme-copper oxidase subunit III [Pseudacidobacterium ailaaui]MBX6360792.1 heme-copper oxidase subunit III [Pseudacidobacterium ailaaui]MCL6463128.1 heme-copper oxidase subunit III [Pseudacidobacterium ailaaui]MDI3255294.1 heme-copper oxidase subunit III [Bacillota bacterium]